MRLVNKFKQTEIGMIPEDWEILRIGDVADVIGGGTPSTKDKDNFGGDISWITPKDLSNYNYRYIKKGTRNITEKGLKNSSAKLLPKGTVLLTTRAPIGYVVIAENEVTTNQGFRSLIPNKKTTSEFLYYQLKLNTERLKSNASGTTFGELAGSRLKAIKFTFPSLQEQTSIAKILSDLDSKIELLQKQNKNLEVIAQAIFKHWFVDFEFPNEEGKPYKSSGGEMVFNEELGKEIPKGWETDSLRSTIDYYIGGGWGEETKNNDFEIEAFVIRGTDIPSVKEGNVKNIPLRYHKKSNYDKRVLKNKDIVLEISGGSKGQPVGRSFLVNDIILKQLNDKAICASFCKLMRVKDKFSPFYISLLLDKIYENEDIMKYQLQSTGISNFNFEYFLDDVKILKIPNYIIIKFNEISERIFNKKNQNGYEANTLSKTRDLLLPKLMSGKISVKEFA